MAATSASGAVASRRPAPWRRTSAPSRPEPRPPGAAQNPSSWRARVASKAMADVDILAPSQGTEGCRWSRRPSTTSESAATASDSAAGTLTRGSGSPVSEANVPRSSCEGQVLPAQDVAATRASPFEGQDVPGRDVVDVGHVEDRVDETGHSPVEEVEHELARGRGGPVARTQREGGEHQRRRQPLGNGAQDLVFGHVLRPLVGAVQMAHVGERTFVGRHRSRHALEAECADRAGVHHPLHTGFRCGRRARCACPRR